MDYIVNPTTSDLLVVNDHPLVNCNTPSDTATFQNNFHVASNSTTLAWFQTRLETSGSGKILPSRLSRGVGMAKLFISLGLTGRGAEVGVWKGEFSKDVLLNIPQLEHYTLVDPWRHIEGWNKPFNDIHDEEFEEIYQQALQTVNQWQHKVTVLRTTSLEAASQITNASLDFVYLDGDHTLTGISVDMALWYDKVKPNGVLCGDDYVDIANQKQDAPIVSNSDNAEHNYEPTMVKPFVDLFGHAKGIPIFDLGKRQFCLVKL